MKTTAGSSVFGRARLSLVKDGRANLGRFQLRPRTNILIHPLLGLDDEHDSLVHHSIRSPSHGRPLMDDGTYLLHLLHHQYILLILATSHKVTKTKFTSSYILLILATSHKVTKSQ